MTENSRWYHIEDEDLYTLSGDDPLGVLSSTKIVVEQGEHAWINQDQLEILSEQWVKNKLTHPDPQPLIWDANYHFHDGNEHTVNWILVLDALNFCFWAEKDQPRWTIDYQGKTLNGYWAEAAGLKRAVEEGTPLWDARYLSTISAETVAHIFRGSQTIPLLEKRVHHLHEVGQVLLEHYDGQFTHMIEEARGSAVKLALQLAEKFPSFHDVATYRGHAISFLKRAQICVADLHNAFNGQVWGAFTDLEKLSAFADYKLPQVLRYYKVIEYHPALADRVDNQELLVPGSEEEIEIRAVTVWACELLRRTLSEQGYLLTTSAIDQRLWLAGQQADEMRPYHRTRTIYY